MVQIQYMLACRHASYTFVFTVEPGFNVDVLIWWMKASEQAWETIPFHVREPLRLKQNEPSSDGFLGTITANAFAFFVMCSTIYLPTVVGNVY